MWVQGDPVPGLALAVPWSDAELREKARKQSSLRGGKPVRVWTAQLLGEFDTQAVMFEGGP